MRELKCSKCGKVAIKLQPGSLVDKGCSVKCGACSVVIPRETLDSFKMINDLLKGRTF